MIFLYYPTPVVPHLHIIKEHIYIAFIADVNKAVAVFGSYRSVVTPISETRMYLFISKNY